MRKKALQIGVYLIMVLALLAPQAPIHSIDLGGSMVEGARKTAGYGAATETTLAETIGQVVRAALSLVGIIFTALMVYAGYLWMTARGEEEKIKKAQGIIKASIIGLIITLGAYSIAEFVVPRVIESTMGGT